MNNIYFVIIAILTIVYVINTVKKGKFSIEESILWVFGSILGLILAIYPKIIDSIANFLNIDYPPSLLFILCIVFLVLINFRNSKKIATQQEKVVELAQQLAIIKSEKRSGKNED